MNGYLRASRISLRRSICDAAAASSTVIVSSTLHARSALVPGEVRSPFDGAPWLPTSSIATSRQIAAIKSPKDVLERTRAVRTSAPKSCSGQPPLPPLRNCVEFHHARPSWHTGRTTSSRAVRHKLLPRSVCESSTTHTPPLQEG